MVTENLKDLRAENILNALAKSAEQGALENSRGTAVDNLPPYILDSLCSEKGVRSFVQAASSYAVTLGMTHQEEDDTEISVVPSGSMFVFCETPLGDLEVSAVTPNPSSVGKIHIGFRSIDRRRLIRFDLFDDPQSNAVSITQRFSDYTRPYYQVPTFYTPTIYHGDGTRFTKPYDAVGRKRAHIKGRTWAANVLLTMGSTPNWRGMFIPFPEALRR